MLAARSIPDQLTAHQLRLDAAASSVISGVGESRPAPSILPVGPEGQGPFPESTWHVHLPDTGLDSLAEWTAEGLSDANRTRIENVVSVYSLGFHQLIRAVRAGMVTPSSTVASIWKKFVFLLNDCMPDGSVYAMRIAAMEREQSVRARELIVQRESELARLVQLESDLQQTVRELDRALRHVQTHRQEAESARLEALDSIEEQEARQRTTTAELAELDQHVQQWQTRFKLAHNRQRMLAEDARQYHRMHTQLKEQQYQTLREVRTCATSRCDVYSPCASCLDAHSSLVTSRLSLPVLLG